MQRTTNDPSYRSLAPSLSPSFHSPFSSRSPPNLFPRLSRRARSYTSRTAPRIRSLSAFSRLLFSLPISLSHTSLICIYWVIEVKTRPRMYLDRHDSREDLPTKIYRRHDPVGGPRRSLKRFQDASIPRDESLSMGNPGVNEFSTRLSHHDRRYARARVLRNANFSPLNDPDARAPLRLWFLEKDIVAARRVGSPRVPLYLRATLAECTKAVQLNPYPAYLAWEFLPCIQRPRLLPPWRTNSARFYRARTLISPLSSRDFERKMNSLPTPRIIIMPVQYVAECNCGSTSAIL